MSPDGKGVWQMKLFGPQVLKKSAGHYMIKIMRECAQVEGQKEMRHAVQKDDHCERLSQLPWETVETK